MLLSTVCAKQAAWQLYPIVLLAAEQRQDFVCRECLIGAQSFSDEETQDPLLRGRDYLRNPCDRVAPFSLDYASVSAFSHDQDP